MVVATTISTEDVNIASLIIPNDLPKFAMINATSALGIIPIPILKESLVLNPTIFAPKPLPRIFPTTATAVIAIIGTK